MNQETFPTRYFFQSWSQENFGQMVFPTRGQQVGVRTNVAQQEPRDLECLTMTLATRVVEDVSMYIFWEIFFLDILTSELWAILERPPSLLDCKLTLRRLLVLHNQEVFPWHPLLQRPSLVTQTNPGPSVNCHAGNFFWASPTAAFASGIFIAWGTGTNLCTKFEWPSELNPFSAMWSSWSSGKVDSKRFLVDSWTSTRHACFVFLDVAASLGFAVDFSQLVQTFLRPQLTKHSTFHRNLQLFRAFSTVSLNSPSSGSTK